jgi:hypothetical protein
MEGALRAGIVVNSPIGGSHYRFSHVLVREVLYRDLPTKRRVRLHAEIGAAVEEIHKHDLKPHLAALAHHFRATGDAQRAIDYLIAAADGAEASMRMKMRSPICVLLWHWPRALSTRARDERLCCFVSAA